MNEVYFSPGDTCKKAIIKSINNAVDHLKICVFTISDDQITHAIIQAFRRGVMVRVITDDDKTYDKGSDIYQLFKEGIAVRTDNSEHFMHHKFALIDDKILITGSFNWTRSASKYNQENIIVTTENDLRVPYIEQFNHLWTTMITYQ